MRARNPATLNEHIRHKAAYDKRPILTTFADKAAVREIVQATVGEKYLTEVYVIADRYEDVPWQDLPDQYVAKVTHGSGGIVFVTNDASPDSDPPPVGPESAWGNVRLHPTRVDSTYLQKLFHYWLSLDYSWTPGQRLVEHCYRDIPHRILVEELLQDTDGKIPADYKFFVIGGDVAFIQVDLNRFNDHRRAIMSASWDLLPVSIHYPAPLIPPTRPANLEEMTSVAVTLGALAEDFCRVDLYDLGDRVVFGEITNYPEAGSAVISPASFDLRWGSMWPEHLAYGRGARSLRWRRGPLLRWRLLHE